MSRWLKIVDHKVVSTCSRGSLVIFIALVIMAMMIRDDDSEKDKVITAQLYRYNYHEKQRSTSMKLIVMTLKCAFPDCLRTTHALHCELISTRTLSNTRITSSTVEPHGVKGSSAIGFCKAEIA